MNIRIKKAIRFIQDIKKNPRLNLAFIKPIVIIPAIFFSLQLHGSTANDYTADISNPFHDIFNAYYSNQVNLAMKLLHKQFNKQLKNQAYINYGLILEHKGNFAEAEKYYRKALGNSEMIALIYLHDHYKKHDQDKIIPLLEALEGHMQSCWIDYEKAAYYAETGNKEAVLKYLSQAAEKGFSSVELLRSDTAFDAVRDTSGFKKIMRTAEKNASSSPSVTAMANQLVYEYEKDKPFGKSTELDAAAYFEKTGKDSKALNILTSLLESGQSFRNRSITLFWLARIHARKGNEKKAKKYLNYFKKYIAGKSEDKTGFKDLISPLYKDIILNDKYLKKIAVSAAE